MNLIQFSIAAWVIYLILSDDGLLMETHELSEIIHYICTYSNLNA